ncbi:Ion transport protein [Chitinispirillum alkaliphilum]|nr:Ion transport protein [Chitinispirillum alkaliphilum]
MSKVSRNKTDDVSSRDIHLQRYENRFETPVRILGLIWLLLVLYELIIGIHPLVTAAIYVIWAVFVADFLIRIRLSPHRVVFLKKNVLTVFSLMVPALRFLYFLRVLRAFRLLRGMRLVNVVGTLNRSKRTLRTFLGTHHSGYVIVLTLLVTLLGSAGMYAFEGGKQENGGIETYWDALYFTSMIMVTIGPQAWPVTAEGRFLSVLLALYAFAVFGYITAVLATFFIGQDRKRVEVK